MRTLIRKGWPFILVGLLLVHPWLFGIRGLLDSGRFERGLRTGMSLAEVQRLKNTTDSYNSPDPIQVYGTDPTYAPWVEYATWETFCAAGGNQYILYFDAEQNLRSWKVQRFLDGC